MRHPTDPPHMHAAAANLGRGMAEGRVMWGDVQAVARAVSAGKPGLQARLCWTAHDTADAHAKALWQAEDDLRARVRPMIEARAQKHEIEEAAGPFADVLTWPRIFQILRDEVARARFKARWR